MIKNYPILKKFVHLFFLLFSIVAFSQIQIFTTSGSIAVPAGVTQVTVEVWGAGGGGGRSIVNKYSAGGGGGGAYTIAVIDGLVTDQSIDFTVGSGGVRAGADNTNNNLNGGDGGVSTFLTVTANGGKGGGGVNTTIVGVAGAGGTGGTYSGGAGSNGFAFNNGADGGGGGSSAGFGNPGTPATTSTGAIAPAGSDGGNGGNGGNKSVVTPSGSIPGGGGGGSIDTDGKAWGYLGGNGGDGLVRITWTYIDFIGTANSDYVYFGNNYNLLATEPFSLEAWVLQTNDKMGTHTIISKGDAKTGNLRGYHLFLYDGKPTFNWYNNSGVPLPTISSPNAINDGKWHHISMTYNGSIAKLYVDGVDVVPAGVAFTSIATGTQPFLIGAMHDSSPATNPKNNFDGYIDEVRVWNVALTEQQIREMMNQRIIQNETAVRGKTIPLDITGGLLWDNLKGYYPMNDGPTIRDKSNNGKHGLIKNMFSIQPNTAPLPYKSITGGNWETSATWENNSMQYLPNTTINGKKISWNIVETSHNVNNTTGHTVLGLLINSASKLVVKASDSLRITRYLKLDGSIDLEGESQLLQDTGSVLDATSTGTIEIDQQGTGDSFNYNYWSSPVRPNIAPKTYSIGGVLKDGTDVAYKPINFGAAHTWAEGDLGSSPIRLSTYWMYKLENSKGYAAWTRISNNISIKVGEGYTMKGSNTIAAMQNYTFVGKPNNGDISLPIAVDNDYLVGNPYPSALDAWTFIDNNPDITGPLYFWEHYGGGTHNLAGYQGGYATYTKAGGVSASMGPAVAGISTLGTSSKGKPGRYVPVGQAFFVVGGAANGYINFKNSQRIFVKESQRDTYNDPFSVFMKTSNTKVKDADTDTDLSDLRPKFRIGFDAPKISHRQLLLTIDEKATPAFDRGYEAEIYEIFVDDFYWMLDGKKYIIQATNNVGLNSEVPLGIQLSKTGMVTVKIDALENVDDDTSIYLKDKVTGESFNMREKPVQFNLVAGKYADRFVLVFKTQKLMAEDVKAEILIPAAAQPIIEGIHVFMNNATGELQIKNNSTQEIVSVALINAAGQTVKTWNTNFNTRTISLPLSTATGVYLVQINTKTGNTVKKISAQ